MLEGVFAERLPARGHHVRWVMPATPGSPTGSLQWGGSVVDVVRGTTGRPWSSVSATCRVLLRASRIIQHDADVVVVRNSIRLFVLALVMQRIRGVPFVYQFSFPTAERSLRLAREGRVRTPLVTRIIAKVGIHARSYVLRRADAVMAISDAMRDRLVRTGGVEVSRIVVVPLGAEGSSPDPNRSIESGNSGSGRRP